MGLAIFPGQRGSNVMLEQSSDDRLVLAYQ